jgi:hypothetical protein
MNRESLSTRVNRAKARWLKRVMYESPATSTQKCFAYAMADHLNCVTLDCWPAQLRLIRLLGRKSEKTAQRAGRALETLGLITLRRPKGKAGYRYAPVFLPGDEDKSVLGIGRARPETPDTNVGQSSLDIQFRSSSTADAAKPGTSRPSTKSSFNPAKRGAIEVALAAMLGKDGMQILQRLASIDDAIVDRLCREYAEGTVGKREVAAARLAANQA